MVVISVTLATAPLISPYPMLTPPADSKWGVVSLTLG